MQSSFQYCFPAYIFRFTFGYSGVLITSTDCSAKLNAIDLQRWFDHFLVNTISFGPQLPPTRQELFNRQLCHVTAQTMIVFAILGWILPIVPGTPFFIVAWSLGWRPPGSKHSVPVE